MCLVASPNHPGFDTGVVLLPYFCHQKNQKTIPVYFLSHTRHIMFICGGVSYIFKLFICHMKNMEIERNIFNSQPILCTFLLQEGRLQFCGFVHVYIVEQSFFY